MATARAKRNPDSTKDTSHAASRRLATVSPIATNSQLPQDDPTAETPAPLTPHIIRPTPAIGKVAGPALQQAIADVNAAWLNLVRLCALLGPSEPMAADLIGLSPALIEKFDNDYVMRRMRDMSLGFPLVRPTLSEATLQHMINGGGAGSDAVLAAFTASMPLHLIERASKPARSIA